LVFHDVPEQCYRFLQNKEDVVFLESTRNDQDNGRSLLFVDPIEILQIHKVSELANLFTCIQNCVQQGCYLAGYFAYECGYHIEKLSLLDYQSETYPLAWFGVYQQPIIYDHTSGKLQGGRPYNWDAPQSMSMAEMDYLQQDSIPSTPSVLQDEVTPSLDSLHFDLDETEYNKNISRIKDYICAGDVYQINFTGRYHFTFDGSPIALYRALKNKQRTSYSAYIRAAGQHILCLSPELFFAIKGQHITARPMKGTISRGRTQREDQHLAQWLSRDSKNRAENVMIVDLLRNDLGRLCQTGSVTVPQLFTIEKYNTLFHMTSTVEGTLRDDVDYFQVFSSLFPCGSVTGAPKIRAMEIIKELESAPRGVYTGAIGYFAPTSDSLGHSDHSIRAMFNVAIRTVVLRDGHGKMGVGSGIVYDSTASDEYAECVVKAHFLTDLPVEFDILEAILWNNGYQHLDKHLRRIADSAYYFQYPYDQTSLQRLLAQLSANLVTDHRYKVRLKLNRTGQWHSEAIEIPGAPSISEQIVVLSSERTDSQDRMYYHKTTHRPLYDRASRFAREHGYADVLFLNEKGEVTEGATNNIFIECDNALLTPPLSCGLLNGIYRQHILETNSHAREAMLHLEDLLGAEKIYICNAVRGLRQVRYQSQQWNFPPT
jgi:para-aminobenzoate synthetase / 4-amino-4-deoxychorismate lyase